ncbi:MAG: hypothetical protein ACYC4R_02165 [Anaerolineae bacterium]
MDLFAAWKQATPYLEAGDLDTCRHIAVDALRSVPETPYHIAADLCFTNDPAEVAAVFDAFVRHQSSRMDIKAVYTETNEFDCNPDLWFFSLFAFSSDGGYEVRDWLCDYEAFWDDRPTLIGMEALQEVYATFHHQSELEEYSCFAASLLVIVSFQQLIQRAVPLMREKRFPIYAQGHDTDMVYRI